MANKRQEKKLEKEQNNKDNFIGNILNKNENVKTASTNNQKPQVNINSNNAQPSSQANTQASDQAQNANKSNPSNNQTNVKNITNTKGKLNWSATVDVKVLAVLHGLESEYHLSNVSEAIQLLYTHNLKSLIGHGNKELYDITKKSFLLNKVPKAREHYLKFYSHLKYNRQHNLK